MKHTFSIILLCVLIGNILPSKSSRKRIPSRFSLLKLQKKSKDKVRKLEIDTTDSDEPGNSTATIEVVKIKKFHNYINDTANKKISFSVFFYFFGGIPRNITIPLIINTKSRIRILAETKITSYCNLKDKYTTISAEESGANVDYKCEANTDSNAEIESVKVDESKDMFLDGNEFSFTSETIDKNSYATNITNSPNYTIIGVLDDSTANFEGNTFTIVGSSHYEESDKTINGQKFNMKFINYTDNKGNYETKSYPCEGKSSSKLSCTGVIQTYLSNMTDAESEDSNIYLKINMKKSDDDDEIKGTNSSSSTTYPDSKKSSGGLSGGAIAGIVIAGVVVLAGATTAAILLGRSKPPLDQTSNMVISSTKIV